MRSGWMGAYYKLRIWGSEVRILSGAPLKLNRWQALSAGNTSGCGNREFAESRAGTVAKPCRRFGERERRRLRTPVRRNFEHRRFRKEIVSTFRVIAIRLTRRPPSPGRDPRRGRPGKKEPGLNRAKRTSSRGRVRGLGGTPHRR